MDNTSVVRNWMIIAGVALLGAGLLGFVADNPIASSSPDAIFRVNAVHNVIHLLTGAKGLANAYGTPATTLGNATIAFGVVYGLVGILLVIDPTMFGLLQDAPANMADFVLHAALAVVSVALGYMARERVPERSGASRI
jgi:hypothetical protein